MFVQLQSVVLILAVGTVSSFYEGYKIVELNLQSNEEINVVLKLSEKYQGDIWIGPSKVIPTEIMIIPQQLQSFLKALDEKKIDYKIVVKNVRKIIDNPAGSKRYKRMPNIFNKTNPNVVDHFATYEEIGIWVDFLSKSFDFVSSHVYGKTYEGRDLRYIKVSTGSKRKSIIIDGGIHGREWLSISTVNYIVEKIIYQYFIGYGKIVQILSQYDFYIIPMFNPDGYAFTHTKGNRFWRKNRRPTKSRDEIFYGVDLNRNFDINFGEFGTSKDPQSILYCGEKAFSESETSNFLHLVKSLGSNLKLYFSIHAFSQLWLVPFDSNITLPEDDLEMRRVAKIGTEALFEVNKESYVVGSAAELLYPASGNAIDWVKYKAGIKYAYTIEVRPKVGAYTTIEAFNPPISEIKDTGEEVFAGLLATIESMKV